MLDEVYTQKFGDRSAAKGAKKPAATNTAKPAATSTEAVVDETTLDPSVRFCSLD